MTTKNTCRAYTQEDIQKMGDMCDAIHNQEYNQLKAKFSELDKQERKYELYRYERFNTHIEIILRTEDRYGEEDLISMMFDKNQWYNMEGHCTRRTFDEILSIINDFWDNAKDYVLLNDKAFGTIATEDAEA